MPVHTMAAYVMTTTYVAALRSGRADKPFPCSWEAGTRGFSCVRTRCITEPDEDDDPPAPPGVPSPPPFPSAPPTFVLRQSPPPPHPLWIAPSPSPPPAPTPLRPPKSSATVNEERTLAVGALAVVFLVGWVLTGCRCSDGASARERLAKRYGGDRRDLVPTRETAQLPNMNSFEASCGVSNAQRAAAASSRGRHHADPMDAAHAPPLNGHLNGHGNGAAYGGIDEPSDDQLRKLDAPPPPNWKCRGGAPTDGLRAAPMLSAQEALAALGSRESGGESDDGCTDVNAVD